MATPVHTINVMEKCRVSPPSGSVAETSLPLTFFDLIWLRLNVVVRSISFFELSDCKVQTHLPNFKRSLSLALQHFYPLAGTLRLSPQTGEYEIYYTDGDSVTLTVATESDSDFHDLVTDHPIDTANFHPLVAELQASDLISLQLTVFPNSGFSIGLAVRHVVADGRSIMNFMRHWGSICRLGHESDSIISSPLPLPLHDRALIPDPNGLKRIFLDHVQMAMAKQGQNQQNLLAVQAPSQHHMVQATFVLTRAKIEELRQRVTMARVHMGDHVDKKPLHVSSFVLTCAHVWVCLTKAQALVGEQMVHVNFGVDCRDRMRVAQPIPASYFGNCITMCIVSARGSDIARGDDDDGFVVACERIGRAIQRFDDDDDDGVLGTSDRWFRRLLSIMEAGERIIPVAGSPRLGFYDMDFGSGRPSKVVVTSIEQRGGISLAESRDGAGRGIEVGLALPKHEMEQFTYYYDKGLKNY